jgi:hypothetical protein
MVMEVLELPSFVHFFWLTPGVGLAQKLVADGFKVMQRRHEIWTIERNARIMLVFKLVHSTAQWDCGMYYPH